MIKLEQVGFRYSGASEHALEDISFSLSQGSVLALLGPNGAGKTTLLRLLCGRLSATQGKIKLPMDWLDANGTLEMRLLGLLIENPGIYARLSIQEYLAFFGSFYPIVDLKHRIQFLCNILEIGDLTIRLSSLSLGTRQKVHLVRSLLHHPKLLLLDEPTSNLDPESRDAFWSLVREANLQEGTTVFICSHQLAEIESKCHTMGFLHEGKLKAFGSLASIRQSLQSETQVVIRLLEPEETIRFSCQNPAEQIPAQIASLVAQGKKIISVQSEEPSLEDLYRRLLYA